MIVTCSFSRYERDVFLHLFATNTGLQVVTRTASSTVMELVSQIGGTFGFFLGFSVLSLAEVAAAGMKRVMDKVAVKGKAKGMK